MKLGSLPAVSALQAQPLPDALQQLREIRNQLVHPTNGSIKSGYLRLSQRGTLNVGGWMTTGSHSQATQSLRALIHQAYEGRLSSPGKLVQIDKALDRYLQKTDQAIGSRTFVRMLDELEREMPADDLQAPRHMALPKELAASRLRPDAYEHFLSGPEVRAMRGNSPIDETAMAQFEKLAEHTPKVVMEHFKSLMFPSTSMLNPADAVHGPDTPRTFAMGDADGSMGRMVLHAMASGVAQLPDEALPALGAVLTAELRCDNDLRSFQTSESIANALDQIAQSLVLRPKVQADGQPACIFLGDILSDRFTNNQEAMGSMIYKLSGYDPDQPQNPPVASGVRFIAGNHDTCPLDRGKKNATPNASWGGHARRVLSEDAHRRLLIDCFRAADYSAGVLSTHNGVRRHPEGGYESGLTHWVKPAPHLPQSQVGQAQLQCMRLEAKSPSELARKMNHAFRQHLVNGRSMQELISTNFRPEDHEMTAQAMAFKKRPELRQVHGHNGSHNEDNPGVTNLNARDQNLQFAPTSRIIEYAPARAGAAHKQAIASVSTSQDLI